MQGDIDRVLIDRKTIAGRIDAVAEEICQAIGQDTSASLTIVPILTGSIIFLADLMRHLPLYLQINMISVRSYPGRATSSQGVTIHPSPALPESFAGQRVLIVDDILDSGRTLTAVTKLIRDRQAAEVWTCVLLRKQRPEAMAFPVDFVCFDIPDEFVAGYGLDYDGYYRNLPEIVTLKPKVYAQP